MRFGISLPNYGRLDLHDALPRVARAAEAAGYASVWVSDHVLVPQRFGPVFGRTIEPMLALGYLAGATTRVRLGTSIIILPQRDPILLAKQAAGIDQLSSGRLDLGVGVGWMQAQFAYFRADYRRRGRMADEYIRVMRELWTDDPCEFHGEFINYDDAYLEPKPVQPGGPPIHVGGASPAALRRVADLGDAWHASGLGVDEFAAKAAQLRELPGGQGKPVSMRGYVAIGQAAERFRDDSDVLIGGPPAAFVEQFGRYAEAGLGEFVCSFAYADIEDVLGQLDTMAAQVMPAFAWQG